MINKLAAVQLEDHRIMELLKLTPPEKSPLVAHLKDFYHNYSDQSRRSIFSRLDGLYAEQCTDHFFVAVIDGEIAGCLWYGYGRHSNPAANFGNVYVREKFRGLGITNILVPYFKADFDNSGALTALCTCSKEWIVKMYRKVGFEQIAERSPRLMLAKKDQKTDFNDLSTAYFKFVPPFRVISGTFEFRHEIDCLSLFSKELYREFNTKSFLSSAVANCQQALFMQEDGLTKVRFILDSNDHIAGWYFVYESTEKFKIFEFCCHHAISRRELIDLLSESLEKLADGMPLACGSSGDDEFKSGILSECGFIRCGELPGETLWLKTIR